MNTRKILFGIFALTILVVSACTSNSAEDDALYENGIDKNKVILKSIDKNKVILKSIDKEKIIID